MPTVYVQDGAFEKAYRAFKRACEKAGIPTKLRQMEYHEKPTSKRKRMKAAAKKRYAKKLQKEREILMRERVRN